MKSNRAVGNSFEQELCELLFLYGFWSHNLKQDHSGQPADIIAVRNRCAHLIDCKNCEGDKFDLRRIEENQITSMDLWQECGNGCGWSAIKIKDEIRMIAKQAILDFAKHYNSIASEVIREYSLSFETWVKVCR